MGAIRDIGVFAAKWVIAPMLAFNAAVSTFDAFSPEEHQKDMGGAARFVDDFVSNAYKGVKIFTGSIAREVGGDLEEFKDTEEGQEALDILSEGVGFTKGKLNVLLNGGVDCDDPDDYALHAEECGMDTEYASKEDREAAETEKLEP